MKGYVDAGEGGFIWEGGGWEGEKAASLLSVTPDSYPPQHDLSDDHRTDY